MRAAIIGTGGIAEIHARAIRLLGGKVVGACGRSKASAEAFGAGRAYGDVQEMLDREKPEVVRLLAEPPTQGSCAGSLRCRRTCSMRKARCRFDR